MTPHERLATAHRHLNEAELDMKEDLTKVERTAALKTLSLAQAEYAEAKRESGTGDAG